MRHETRTLWLSCFPLLAVVLLALLGLSCSKTAVPTTHHKLACAGVFCGAGKICDPTQGVCVASEGFCGSIVCGVAQICNYTDGKCVSNPDYENPCTGLTCEGDLICNPRTGLCVQKGTFCQGVTCHPTLQTCNSITGACQDANPFDPNACLTDCAVWEVCFEGQCISSSCESHGACPTNMECGDGECSPRSCDADYQCPFYYPGVCAGAPKQCAVPACESDNDCSVEGQSCVQGTCGIAACGTDNGGVCSDGFACLLHNCVFQACTADSDCETTPGCDGGECTCDGNLGQCIVGEEGCYSNGDCPIDATCFHGECVEASDTAALAPGHDNPGGGQGGGGTGGGTGGDPEGCDEDQFTCNDGECIPDHWYCDDFVDCDGGEDEDGCPGPTESFCGDGQCDVNEDCESCAGDCGPCGEEGGEEEGGGEESGEESGSNPDSCEGNCGGNAGNCWCDSGCVGLGDCCEDACEACDVCAEAEGGEAAVPPTEDACTATDKAIDQAGSVDGAMATCVPPCGIGNEGTDQCIAECLSQETGISDACASCFGTLTVCMFDNCLETCLGSPDSSSCQACLIESGCNAAFQACSGIIEDA